MIDLKYIWRKEKVTNNITVYPVGTRVPRNQQVEKIVQSVIKQSAPAPTKLKRFV